MSHTYRPDNAVSETKREGKNLFVLETNEIFSMQVQGGLFVQMKIFKKVHKILEGFTNKYFIFYLPPLPPPPQPYIFFRALRYFNMIATILKVVSFI